MTKFPVTRVLATFYALCDEIYIDFSKTEIVNNNLEIADFGTSRFGLKIVEAVSAGKYSTNPGSVIRAENIRDSGEEK